jgi:hypothetical protein
LQDGLRVIGKAAADLYCETTTWADYNIATEAGFLAGFSLDSQSVANYTMTRQSRGIHVHST